MEIFQFATLNHQGVQAMGQNSGANGPRCFILKTFTSAGEITIIPGEIIFFTDSITVFTDDITILTGSITMFASSKVRPHTLIALPPSFSADLLKCVKK